MTREEADKLQEYLDEYVAMRDAPQAEDPKTDPEPEVPIDETDPKAKLKAAYQKLKKKVGPGSRVSRVFAYRMNLASYIEPLLPEARLTGKDGMDFMAMLSPFASALGIDVGKAAGTIPVVDGFEKVDADEIGDEEYERLYCVRVPGDVMKEALSIRSSKSMFELAGKDMQKR